MCLHSHMTVYLFVYFPELVKLTVNDSNDKASGKKYLPLCRWRKGEEILQGEGCGLKLTVKNLSSEMFSFTLCIINPFSTKWRKFKYRFNVTYKYLETIFLSQGDFKHTLQIERNTSRTAFWRAQLELVRPHITKTFYKTYVWLTHIAHWSVAKRHKI